MKQEISKVTIAGAGIMGSGIAQVFAQAGFETTIVDLSEVQLKGAIVKISASLAKFEAKQKITSEEARSAIERLSITTDLKSQTSCDLFIEAVPEDISLKIKVFQNAEALFGPKTIFASNTSALSITEMAAATSRPQNVIGLHFFNPVPVMKLLEIVVGAQTSAATLQSAQDIASKLGKEAIVVKDSPGFATSRLGICLGFEAIRMLEEGVASAEDIDKAMVLGYGHPIGPLRLTDLVGLDVRLAIGEHLHQALGAPRFAPPALLKTMVKEGRLGQKSGQGFYTFDKKSV